MGQFDRKAQSQPKHGKPSSSGASKAAPRPNNGTPEWKGIGYNPKKKSTAGPTPSSAQESFKLEPTLPLDLEQRMLEVFRATFPASSDFEGLKPILYKVNDALLRRDLDAAFAEEEYLEAYAIRWSPSRALGYAQLLAWICAERADDACIQQLVGSNVPSQDTAKAVCFGGGAAEIMALSGLMRHSRPSEAAGKPSTPATTEVSDSLEALKISATATSHTTPLLHLSHLDIANWNSVLSKLEEGLNTPPVLSKYASATARATNASFLSPGAVQHSFMRADILDSSTEDLRSTIGSAPALLTLLSTLNDLYTTSMPRTTAFLKKLTAAAPQGSLLLVVDAPGAHTEVTASSAEGEEEKRKYPMNLLLDFALVPKPSTKKVNRKDGEDEEARPKWEKVLEKSSLAYRLREGLRYPGSLENLRFQVHLFRRL